MRATLVVLLVTVCMLPLMPMAYPPAMGAIPTMETRIFGNGAKDITVDFESGNSYDLSVQTGLYIDQASMKISSVGQGPGSKKYPTNVSVDFGGDNSLEWSWRGPGYGPLGHQTVFKNDKASMDAAIPNGGGFNDSVAFRLPKTANVKSATINVSAGTTIGTPGKILVLSAVFPYYGYDDDPVKKLKAFTNDFSQVDQFDTWSSNGKKPTWDDIKDYSAILTFTEGFYYGGGYTDYSSTGNLLADYVDAGGGVVCCWWNFYGPSSYSPAGRFSKDKYFVIEPTTSYSYTSSGIGTVAIPNHPVMANVSSISFPYSGYTYRSYAQSASPGATVISSWGDGNIMAATKEVNGVARVDINMFPASYDSYDNQWGSYPYTCYYGDGDDLLKNAMLFVGRKPIDATVDLLNDASLELNRTQFMGNYTFPDFAASINSYLGSAPVSFEDKYGNKFVDVPINATGRTGGRLSFGNLDITYDYTTDVNKNPGYGDLVSSIADLQSSILGTTNVSIPIVMNAASSGMVKLHSLYIKMSPPNHKPTIVSFSPAASTVIKENTELEFTIDCTDWYTNPMTYQWYYDEVAVDGATSNKLTRSFDFNSAGNHTVRVDISNEQNVNHQDWNLVVVQVSRPPAIDNFFPPADPTIDENETQLLQLNASDPDKDPLTYKWTLDGKAQPAATDNSFLFSTDFSSAGDHTVKALVSDPGGLSVGKNWTIHVNNVNIPPQILTFSPKTDPRILEKESWQFSVSSSDFDGQTLTTTWYVDDVQAFVGNPFTYTSDYKSAGIHKIRASVTDGKEIASHTWELTVVNVNRLPLAIIDAPTQAEFMENAQIHFSAQSSYDPDNETLTYGWKEGGVNVSDQVQFDRAFMPGLHTLTLEVRDRSGGSSSSTVRFRVRFVEISVLIGLDRLETVAGDNVDVIITLSNVGDTNATDLNLEVMVDGRSIGTKSYADIAAGGGTKELFKWKAVKGPHTITAKLGEQTWTKDFSVAAAPAPPASAGIADYIWPILLVVMVVGLIGFGAMVLRKK